jgi:hypothetical protein
MILTYTEQRTIIQDWDINLRIIQFLYNNTEHSTTHHTPFYLVHGRTPRTPLCITDSGKFFTHYQSPPQQFASELQDRLNTAFDLVDQYLIQTPNEAPKFNPFSLGQMVWLFNQTLSSKNKPRKLMFDWYGPYTVSQVKSKTTVDLKSQDSKKLLFNIHVSRLKAHNPQHSIPIIIYCFEALFPPWFWH